MWAGGRKRWPDRARPGDLRPDRAASAEKGQVFVGIDVIGGNLTEINVTSPTGIQELERFDGINVADKIWEAIESKRAVSMQFPLGCLIVVCGWLKSGILRTPMTL